MSIFGRLGIIPKLGHMVGISDTVSLYDLSKICNMRLSYLSFLELLFVKLAV